MANPLFELFAAKISKTFGTTPDAGLIQKVWEASRSSGFDPLLVLGLVTHETQGTWNPEIIAQDKHGYGLFQIDDRWHKDKQFKGDPEAHIQAGLSILSDFSKRSSNPDELLSLYNTGNKTYGMKNGYVDAVKAKRALFEEVLNNYEGGMYFGPNFVKTTP